MNCTWLGEISTSDQEAASLVQFPSVDEPLFEGLLKVILSLLSSGIEEFKLTSDGEASNLNKETYENINTK